jgi:putative ABC transport system substrate-binding protein
MHRRAFVSLLSAAAFWGRGARAEQAQQIARIGCLHFATAHEDASSSEAFRAGLRDFGYVEGENILIEHRYADWHDDRLAGLVTELIELKVEVIVTAATGVYVAHQVTTTVPIVIAAAGDVVAMGIVDSLAHPGGNVTGSIFFLPELMAKRLDLIKQIAPSTTRVGVLMRRNVQSMRNVIDVMEAAAKALRMELQTIEVGGPSDFESAFSTWAGQKISAVVVWDIFNTQLAPIASIGAKYRLASIGPVDLAASGGLMGYGVDLRAMWRRAAYFVDKILKGAKPGDIPIEQATKFVSAINLKTAKALGLDIPPTLLAAADEVIE